MNKLQHQCELAKKYGALYFYSPLWKGWAEKYTRRGIFTTAFRCKFCDMDLQEIKKNE